MNEWILIFAIIFAFLVVVGLILILIVLKNKKSGDTGETNYQAFFYIGINWIPVGVVFMITINTALGIAFIGIGVSLIAIGLSNSDKWEKRSNKNG